VFSFVSRPTPKGGLIWMVITLCGKCEGGIMCLVVAVWNADSGFVVSEGRRSRALPSGKLVPVADDVFKIWQLADDLILGWTGDTEVTAAVRSSLEKEPANFKHLHDVVIPREMTRIAAQYAFAKVSVLLLGNDDGKVRCAGWGSKMPDPAVSVAPRESVNTLVLGLSAQQDANLEVSQLIDSGMPKPEAVEQIVRDLAKRYTDLNGNTKVLGVSNGK
jgi:hypothetical protein